MGLGTGLVMSTWRMKRGGSTDDGDAGGIEDDGGYFLGGRRGRSEGRGFGGSSYHDDWYIGLVQGNNGSTYNVPSQYSPPESH